MSLFRNAIVFSIQTPLTVEEINEKLASHALTPCSTSEMRRVGWVPPKGNEPGLTFTHPSVKTDLLIAMGSEKRLLPASVIKEFVAERALDIEEKQGYKLGRKQMKEIKECVTQELMPRAFILRKKVYAWIDLTNGRLVIDASAASTAEEMITLLIKSLDTISILPVKMEKTPATYMTEWTLSGEAPAQFTLDDNCRLTSQLEDRASISYANLVPDQDEVQKHIEAGKVVTKLAMTWSDRISFAVTDQLSIKRITLVDGVVDPVNQEDDAFDADFLIVTGGLKSMLSELNDAFDITNPPVPK